MAAAQTVTDVFQQVISSVRPLRADTSPAPERPPLQLVTKPSEHIYNWRIVLCKLRALYPGSYLATQSEDEFELTVQAWAEQMPAGISHADLRLLYDRVINARANALDSRDAMFPPGINDFVRHWGQICEQRFRDEQGRAWKAHDDEVRAALPAPAGCDRARPFVYNFQKFGALVHCHCPARDQWGGNGAILVTIDDLVELCRDDKYHGLDFANRQTARYWVCAAGECDFIIAADDVDAVCSVSKQHEQVPSRSDVEVIKASAPRPKNAPGFFEQVLHSWALRSEDLSDEQLTTLRSFLNWWRMSHGNAIPSQEDYIHNAAAWQDWQQTRQTAVPAGVTP